MSRTSSRDRRHAVKVNGSVSRWTEWARTFSEKRRLTSAIWQRPPLVLHGSQGPLQESHYVVRWLHVIQQLFPRIALGIYVVPEKRVVSQVVGRFPQSLVFQFIRNRILVGEGTLRLRETNTGGGSLGFSRNGSVSPIERTFARANVAADVDDRTERRTHAITRVVETCHRLARQVIQRCERMEERRTLSCVLRREGPAAVSIRSDGRPDEITRTSPWGTSVGKPGFAMSTPQASIDLNRLTDQVVRQIDSRMVAYRERMGKVF